jgi:hypothetical protein
LGAAQAEVLHVPGEYLTIQEAVDAAAYGDEILVDAGEYSDPTHPAGAGDTTLCCVILKSGITLTGAGMGETIIDADSLGRGIFLKECDDVRIRHMTIRHCFAEVYGAAIYCKDSSPDIRYVEIVDNYDGGIALTNDSSPTIHFCTMRDNHAKAGGGLDANPGCAPYVYRCDIVNNRAPFAAGVQLRGSAILEGCVIDSNRTTGAVNVLGGGVLITDTATPTLRHCTINYNECFGDGGGICFMGEGTGGIVEDCEIVGNISTGAEATGGGVKVGSQAAAEVRSCLIALNSTTGTWSDGGGLWVGYSSLLMENCTLYGNWTEGDQDQGFGNAGNAGFETSEFIPATIEVTHCIIAASTRGRGVYCTDELLPPDIACCDIYANEGGDEICGITGQDNFTADPLFCDPSNPDDPNFHILEDSPCAPYHHPGGAGTCDDLLIGAFAAGCNSGAEGPEVDLDTLLLANRPNPFSRSTVVAFQLATEKAVTLEVFDPAGRRVAVLEQGVMPAGPHQVVWDGTTLSGGRAASGVYFCQLRAGEQICGRRMLRLR